MHDRSNIANIATQDGRHADVLEINLRNCRVQILISILNEFCEIDKNYILRLFIKLKWQNTATNPECSALKMS